MESTVITPESPHQAHGAHPQTGTGPRGQLEFGGSDNDVVASLAARMYFVGCFTLTTGILVIVMGARLFDVRSILSGTLYAIIGLWTHRASTAFDKIARSHGKDVSHLMFALRDLRNLYSLQVWICTFTLAAAVFGAFTLYFTGH